MVLKRCKGIKYCVKWYFYNFIFKFFLCTLTLKRLLNRPINEFFRVIHQTHSESQTCTFLHEMAAQLMLVLRSSFSRRHNNP